MSLPKGALIEMHLLLGSEMMVSSTLFDDVYTGDIHI